MGRKKNNISLDQPVLLAEKLTTKEIFRDIRNYLAGQFVGATRDDALLDEVVKCLFCKLFLEKGETEPIDAYGDTFDVAKRARTVFAAVREGFPEIFAADTEILLDPISLQYVMKQLSNFSVMDAESDPIGDAFEIFVGSESRGNSGQFFTPRSVTSLLVAALNPQPGESVLDPACGAGGFLASVCAHLINQGMKYQDLSTVSKNLFGIDKDAYLAHLAKAHLAVLTGGHANILNGDSISLQNGSVGILGQLPSGGVDVILTNPPFGSKIIAARPEVLAQFALAKKWVKDPLTGNLAPSATLQGNVPPQVLFVERCLTLLKPGGRLGMVLPESILSNKSYRQVVDFLTTSSDIHAVIGMPEALFKTSGKGGTHTKTCLLIATKAGSSRKTSQFFMAEAKWCGQDSRARLIPHNDLPAIASNFKAFEAGKPLAPSSLGFIVEKTSVQNHVLCPRYYDPEAQQELSILKESHNLLLFRTLVEQKVVSISTGDEIGKLAYGTGNIPFIRTSDISNWELKADPKHGVSREIFESLKKRQDVRRGDILMVRDGTYLIGTCAIVSAADEEILYQSHIYKIRVNENSYGLNPYLLLAILSCGIVQKQIRSKQFTQDIIDSLGDRIHELILPVPKSEKAQKDITDLVMGAVQRRIEARELAKIARASVVTVADTRPESIQALYSFDQPCEVVIEPPQG